MTSKKQRPNNRTIPVKTAVNSSTTTNKKVVIASGDKNSQVLAATVGGAVLGNLIAPGIGGAFIGGLVGALLGNDSLNKGRK